MKALWPMTLANTLNSRLKVQACDDAHPLNFGGFATLERNIIFDIERFRETLLRSGVSGSTWNAFSKRCQQA
jgi:uncharacterized protein (DUF2252 family)